MRSALPLVAGVRRHGAADTFARALFLYGEGALPNKGKGKSYKNVDVCWRR